mgnify:CR=1 FL=1
MTSLNDELKKEYKTTLEMHKDCQCLNIQIKKNIKIRKEVAGTSIFFSVNEFNLLKEEILELIKIAKKTMQTKYKVVYVSTRNNNKKVVIKERKIETFKNNKEFYRKKEENINDSIFRYFLKNDFSRRRF